MLLSKEDVVMMIVNNRTSVPQSPRTDPYSGSSGSSRPSDSLLQPTQESAGGLDDEIYYRPTPPPVWPRVFPGL